jgi:hypothetical protein
LARLPTPAFPSVSTNASSSRMRFYGNVLVDPRTLAADRPWL